MISSESTLVLVEDHDEAYHAWKKAGVRDRTLLHFDAHIDFKWIAPPAESLLEENSIEALRSKLEEISLWSLKGRTALERVHLGNYIHQAVRDRIVGEWIWIYPDAPDPGLQARAVGRILENLAVAAPRSFRISGPSADGCFSGRILEIPFYAVPFSNLHRLLPRDRILLNIDLDFLTVCHMGRPDYPFAYLSRPEFWLSPEDLVEKLCELGLASDFTTLAYSVEEGYSPIALKFLGRELAARLSGSLSGEEDRTFSVLGKYYSAGANRDPSVWIPKLERLAREVPSAAVWFSLAMLYAGENQWDRACACYEKAVREDVSYRSTYNHPGPVLWDLGLYREAAASYETMKRLDPDHPDGLLFDIKRLVRAGKWAEGISAAEALRLRGLDSLALRLGLAECYFRTKQYPAAWNALEIAEEDHVEDLKFPDYLRLKARVASKLGRLDEAILYTQRLNQHVLWGPRIHWELAGLYFRKRNFYKARRHALKTVRQGLVGFLRPWIRWRRLEESSR